MDALTINNNLHVRNVFARDAFGNENVVKGVMNIYIHELLPVLDKFYNAVLYSDYKILPALSNKLRPYFQMMEISIEPLEIMDNPEKYLNDHRTFQKLYIKVKEMVESGIENIKAKLVQMEIRNVS